MVTWSSAPSNTRALLPIWMGEEAQELVPPGSLEIVPFWLAPGVVELLVTVVLLPSFIWYQATRVLSPAFGVPSISDRTWVADRAVFHAFTSSIMPIIGRDR